MLDTFFITIIFIALSTIVGAFVRRINRDKCLKDFCHNRITLENINGQLISGILRVENTGLEIIYSSDIKITNYQIEMSSIVYKQEYLQIQFLIRYHDELSLQNRIDRDRELKKIYHPNFFYKIHRKIKIFFKIIRDSLLEVIDLIINYIKNTTKAKGLLISQDKYVTKIKNELIGQQGMSFDPLLEKYIGHRIVMEVKKNNKTYKYWGILKEYTTEFIEIMNVNYQFDYNFPIREADMIIPRIHGIIRHLGE